MSNMTKKDVKMTHEEQLQLDTLHQLDEQSIHFQKDGNYVKAFDCMERAFVLRRHFFGAESTEVSYASRALGEMCNLLSMNFLQQDNFPVTIELLKKAEILNQNYPAEKATTLNNLACYYRRLGKLHAAMTCLKKALEIETKLQNIRNAADTHLNICAVLSQLGKHEAALENAQQALITLQQEATGTIANEAATSSNSLTSSNSPKHSKKSPNKAKRNDIQVTTSGNTESTTVTATALAATLPLDRVSVMCIAYHNIGVEQEYLRDFTNCVISYKKGVSLAEQYLGEDHTITTTLKNSYLAVKRAVVTRGKEAAAALVAATQQRPPSPGKAAMRLRTVNGPGSPRGSDPSSPSSRAGTGGDKLRFPNPKPSPKSKEKSPPKFPSVDSKSKALPPLNNSPVPPKTAVGERTGLAPDDPLFSPRFNFDSKMSPKPKTKKEKPAKGETREATSTDSSGIASSAPSLETNDPVVVAPQDSSVSDTATTAATVEELCVEENITESAVAVVEEKKTLTVEEVSVYSIPAPPVHIGSNIEKVMVKDFHDHTTTVEQSRYSVHSTADAIESRHEYQSSVVETVQDPITSPVIVENIEEPKESGIGDGVVSVVISHEEMPTISHTATEVDAPILDVDEVFTTVEAHASEAYHVEDQAMSQKEEEVPLEAETVAPLDPVGAEVEQSSPEEAYTHEEATSHDQSFYHEHTYDESGVTQQYTEGAEQYESHEQYAEYTNVEGVRYDTTGHYDHQQAAVLYDHSQSWYAQHEGQGGGEMAYSSGQYETVEYPGEEHQHQYQDDNGTVYEQYHPSSYDQEQYQHQQQDGSSSTSWGQYAHHSYHNIPVDQNTQQEQIGEEEPISLSL